jgi:uncharacterized membrane protein
MVYRILRRVGALEWVAVLGAMAMATSASAISLSCEVQSYSLAVFLILWSFLYYLDLVDPEPARVSRRSRAAFCILACCALLTEYFAGLYLIACVLAPLLVGILRPRAGAAAALDSETLAGRRPHSAAAHGRRRASL